MSQPVRLLQLETGTWLHVSHNEQGERQVGDCFGRPVVTCADCGTTRQEWLVEVELHDCAGELCCEG